MTITQHSNSRNLRFWVLLDPASDEALDPRDAVPKYLLRGLAGEAAEEVNFCLMLRAPLGGAGGGSTHVSSTYCANESYVAEGEGVDAEGVVALGPASGAKSVFCVIEGW